MESNSAQATIRDLEPRDLPELVKLCAEHARYEKADYDPAGKATDLDEYFFGHSPRAHCLVVEVAGDGSSQRSLRLGGYATWSREFSTWGACEYLHMDCLYVRSELRGHGIGAEILRALSIACRQAGLDHLEWQSPAWNEGAIRFYEREGAVSSPKIRFRSESAS